MRAIRLQEGQDLKGVIEVFGEAIDPKTGFGELDIKKV